MKLLDQPRAGRDNLTEQQRSRCMSRVRNRDTDLECVVRSALHKRGLRFRKHARGLPGTPDVAFPRQKVAVFIDGDFWHGYRFPQWKHTQSEFWQTKIETNRARDKRNHARLRRMGWRVIRLWQHEIEQDLGRCLEKVTNALSVP